MIKNYNLNNLFNLIILQKLYLYLTHTHPKESADLTSRPIHSQSAQLSSTPRSPWPTNLLLVILLCSSSSCYCSCSSSWFDICVTMFLLIFLLNYPFDLIFFYWFWIWRYTNNESVCLRLESKSIGIHHHYVSYRYICFHLLSVIFFCSFQVYILPIECLLNMYTDTNIKIWYNF